MALAACSAKAVGARRRHQRSALASRRSRTRQHWAVLHLGWVRRPGGSGCAQNASVRPAIRMFCLAPVRHHACARSQRRLASPADAEFGRNAHHATPRRSAGTCRNDYQITQSQSAGRAALRDIVLAVAATEDKCDSIGADGRLHSNSHRLSGTAQSASCASSRALPLRVQPPRVMCFRVVRPQVC